MCISIKMVALLLALSSVVAVGQDCDALKSGSVSAAVEFLRHAGDEAGAPSCVNQAFHVIASSPPEQALPLLVERLGYKRPLSEGERHGVFMQGDGPSALYPAVRELFVLGKVAEPALVHFIAEPRDATRIERDNALYTILLIHHGNAMDVVQTLTRESKASKDTAAGDHLRDAAKDASKWCDDRIRVKCEDIQR